MATKTDLPTTKDGLQKEESKLRLELEKARLDHAMQKLASPSSLKNLRRQLARVLTKQSQLEMPASNPAKQTSADEKKVLADGSNDNDGGK